MIAIDKTMAKRVRLSIILLNLHPRFHGMLQGHIHRDVTGDTLQCASEKATVPLKNHISPLFLYSSLNMTDEICMNWAETVIYIFDNF